MHKIFVILNIFFLLILSGCISNQPTVLPQAVITFEYNGGEGPMDTLVVDLNTTLTGIYDMATKAGYVFLGWFTDGMLTNRWEASDVVTSDLMLFAGWSITQFSITFESNGGTEILMQFIGQNEAAVRPDDPVKTEYTFVYWYETDENEPFDFETIIETDLILYAKWQLNAVIPVTYTITFDSDGGTEVANQTIILNEVSVKPQDPIKAGYDFIGWYNLAISANIPWNFNLAVQSDMTLTAKWDADIVETYYTVSFETSGGSIIPDILVKENEKIEKPDDPVLINHIFIGWYKDIDLTNLFNFSQDVIITDSILYAKYEMPNVEASVYDVEGFAKGHVSIPDLVEGDAGYYVANNELEFIDALSKQNTANTTAAKIIEIRANLNLGYLEAVAKYPALSNSPYSGILRTHNTPTMHPTLIASGVSIIQIFDRRASDARYGSGLMIYSTMGYTIKHATFDIRRSENIIFRNLKFDELWEWDESGDYDNHDWDYFSVRQTHGIWFDHIELGKSYDGQIDFRYDDPTGVTGATFSYLKLDYQPNQFVRDQIEHLVLNGTSTKTNNLVNAGMSIDAITKLVSFQKKGFLLGGTSNRDNEVELTIMNSWVVNLQDRFPRLRGDKDVVGSSELNRRQGGDVHVINSYYDATDMYNLRQQRGSTYGAILATSPYQNMFTNQAIVSTEGGSIGVENSIFKGVTQVIKTNQSSAGNILYRGKYQVLNSYYELGDYTFTGNSFDIDSPFVTSDFALDPITPFSWNKFDELPYSYEHLLIDIDILEAYLFSLSPGAGYRPDINWLKVNQN